MKNKIGECLLVQHTKGGRKGGIQKKSFVKGNSGGKGGKTNTSSPLELGIFQKQGVKKLPGVRGEKRY